MCIRDSKQTLEYLGKKGFAYYFSHVYRAFLLDDEEAKDRIFQQHMDSQEDYDKAVEQLHNLEDCYDELLECGTITCREDLLLSLIHIFATKYLHLPQQQIVV